MIEDCPFNYPVVYVRWVFYLIKSKNKLDLILFPLNFLQMIFMASYIVQNIHGNFVLIVFNVYVVIFWCYVLVSMLIL